MVHHVKIEKYEGPAGGWGSVRSLMRHIRKQGAYSAAPLMMRHQNKPGGFGCVSCAWAKPEKPHLAEFCENGAKATFWELTDCRTPPEFFERHTVSQLKEWPDHDLEAEGRLTHPMRYDHATDRYHPVTWDEAFAEIGRELRAIRERDPKSVIFYASGRASLETSYMYQLFARLYGNNNLPDSSNMCHESTSVALPESIGVPVGTANLDDFAATDALFFFGQNVGTNSPRMLHQLQQARERDADIVSFNPLREKGLEAFTNPQSPVEMVTRDETVIASRHYQVRAGGDLAAVAGVAKAVFDLDDAARKDGRERLIDVDFIAEHTSGFAEFEAWVRACDWTELEAESGLRRAEMEEAAAKYCAARAVIAVYGMGITQHRMGVRTVQMLVNLLLMRGNIGRRGAGICPVRGHSNVQGQRTVGITEKPELAPLDRLAELYRFEPPRERGMATIEACRGIVEGRVHGFIGLGGNFLRAIPERELMEEKWTALDLTVQVATKLNRSHLVNGKVAYLLPCLGRIERDTQESGDQTVTLEDSTGSIYASIGRAAPASPELLSEPKIVAEMAKATLPEAINVPWDEWVADYGRVREAIEATYPDVFPDFNRRMFKPGGFMKPIPARDRKWETDTGKANFVLPESMQTTFDDDEDEDVFRLMTLRSNDQFNTTIYGYRDRFRGIEGTRMIVMMNRADIARLGLSEGDHVGMRTAADDGINREMHGFRVVPYDIPQGCLGGYYPECNALIPLWQHAEDSMVPAAKSVPVRVLAAGGRP